MCCEILFGSNASLLQTQNFDWWTVASLPNNIFWLPRKIYYICLIILSFLNIVKLQMAHLISSNILIKFCKSYPNNNRLFYRWFIFRKLIRFSRCSIRILLGSCVGWGLYVFISYYMYIFAACGLYKWTWLGMFRYRGAGITTHVPISWRN